MLIEDEETEIAMRADAMNGAETSGDGLLL